MILLRSRARQLTMFLAFGGISISSHGPSAHLLGEAMIKACNIDIEEEHECTTKQVRASSSARAERSWQRVTRERRVKHGPSLRETSPSQLINKRGTRTGLRQRKQPRRTRTVLDVLGRQLHAGLGTSVQGLLDDDPIGDSSRDEGQSSIRIHARTVLG